MAPRTSTPNRDAARMPRLLTASLIVRSMLSRACSHPISSSSRFHSRRTSSATRACKGEADPRRGQRRREEGQATGALAQRLHGGPGISSAPSAQARGRWRRASPLLARAAEERRSQAPGVRRARRKGAAPHPARDQGRRPRDGHGSAQRLERGARSWSARQRVGRRGHRREWLGSLRRWDSGAGVVEPGASSRVLG